MRVFYFGYPGPCGGANTEMFHTISLWRRFGIDVTLIPTWGEDAKMEARLVAMGCQTLHVKIEDIPKVPGLAGAICMSMCNSHFLTIYGVLREMGCKCVWANAMTFMFPHEQFGWQRFGPADAYQFQSEFQRSELEPQLSIYGYRPEHGHLIRGAFDFDEMPYAPIPHEVGGPFVIGRLSRPDCDKWSNHQWDILGEIPYAGRRSLNMGWTPDTGRKLGPTPAWAECLVPQQITTREFLGRCHAMIGLNGGARENWPRVGLEAMAAGVPLVVENSWGWREMVDHGRTGFLCDTDEDFKFWLAYLARDEKFRLQIALNAREAVECLAAPDILGPQWVRLFDALAAQDPKETPCAAA